MNKILFSNEKEDIFTCILIGDCYNKIYEYTFVYDNLKYKTDNCYTVRAGSTVCTVGEEIFRNVSYTSKYLRTEHVYTKGLLHYFWPCIVICILLLIFRTTFEYFYN